MEKRLSIKSISDQYLDHLLNADRNGATNLVFKAIDDGLGIKEVYLDIFQASQHKIGELWQNNEISVAQEHFCSAATQMIMAQLYPRIFNSKKNGLRLVATCVGGELHEIGLRMVADFFEMEGWDTYYLGANTPVESILSTIEKYSADVLAISTSMTFHLEKTKELILKVKESDVGKRSLILVGGRPFNLSHDLWKKVNADAFASDAMEAISVMEKHLN